MKKTILIAVICFSFLASSSVGFATSDSNLSNGVSGIDSLENQVDIQQQQEVSISDSEKISYPIIHENKNPINDKIFTPIDKSQYYEVPENEYIEMVDKLAKDEISRIIKQDQISITSNLLRAANPTPTYEYRTKIHDNLAKMTYHDALAAGQLQGGYRASGYLYYSTEGGNTYTLSVSFAAPWGPGLSFGGSSGAKSGSGIQVTIPNSKDYFKIRANKGYRSTPYTIQRRKVGTSTWTDLSYGVVKGVYHNVHAYCAKV